MKRILPFLCSEFDQERIQTFLEKQARLGWMPETVFGIFWVFRPAAPQNLIFSTVLDPKVSEYTPENTEAQQTYRAYAKETGWEYVTTLGNLQIFCSTLPDPIPLETDAGMVLDGVEKMVQRKLYPWTVFWIYIGLSPVLHVLESFSYFPVEVLAKAYALHAFSFWLTVILGNLVNLSAYLVFRRKARQLALQGELPEGRKLSGFLAGHYLLCCVLLAAAIYRGGLPFIAAIALPAALLLLWQGLRRLLTRAMRKRQVAAKTNRRVNLVCNVLVITALLLLTAGMLPKQNDSSEVTPPPVLTVADLTGSDYTGFQTEYGWDSSILLSQRWGRETDYTSVPPDREPGLEYRIVYVKAPFLYNWCQRQLLEGRHFGSVHYMPIDPRPWGASEAWRLTGYIPETGRTYLLCYEDRIVELELEWVPTDEQISTAANILSKQES